MGTVILVFSFLIALTVHEFAHAWTANFLGDPTAKIRGRISMNPLVHLDIFGTIMIFLAGFGWGKPVPVNPQNLRFPRRDTLLIALAGPLANFLTAIIFASFSKVATGMSASMLGAVAHINIILMAFNMIPVPPLDGADIVEYFLNPVQKVKFREIGAPILFGVIVFESIFHISIIWRVWGPIVDLISAIVFFGA